MRDVDRSTLHCWHGNLLYECEDPEHSTQVARVSNHPDYELVTVTYYQGATKLYTNVTDRNSDMYGGETVETITCPHKHETREAATLCGQRLAKAEARRRNKDNGKPVT